MISQSIFANIAVVRLALCGQALSYSRIIYDIFYNKLMCMILFWFVPISAIVSES
jgi:hypothetical protein